MRSLTARWWRFAICLLLCAVPVSPAVARVSFEGPSGAAWANPPAKAIKKLGQVTGLAELEDIYNRNFDCVPANYHMTYELFGAAPHPGCFVPTAFGSMDALNNMVLGYSSDGAIPVKTFGNQSILPLPKAAAVATLSGAPVLGSYLHLYTYFPSAVQLKVDFLLHPYLQLPPAANLVLSDSAGQPIALNAQTLAYSSNGSWIVVESPWRSFMRINTATLQILPFAPPFTQEAFDLALHSSQVAISNDGRFVAIQSTEFNRFKVYDLASCSGTVTSGLQPLDCNSFDYQPYVNSQISGLTRLRHLRFVNDGLLSFHATAGGTTNSYELAPADKITNLIDYLALGDSYSSGEGAFHYAAGTDTADNTCHQSTESYPYLLTRDIFTAAGGHSVACSGAVIDDIGNTDLAYTGQSNDKLARNKRTNIDQILDNYSPGYIAQYEFVQKYQPRILTVGIGGNDIGFGSIIAACVAPQLGNNTCYSSYEDRKELAGLVDRTYQQWVNLYHQLQAVAPDTRIYAIGYPHIAATDGDCGVNVHLNEDEIAFSQQLIDYLNATIARAASAAGVAYVDISHALDGHRLCEAGSASVAVNGLTAGTDKFHVLGNESYHPNALGQELIEQAILGQTHGFAPSPPANDANPPAADAPLLDAPKSGRQTYNLLPDSSIISGPVEQGGALHITVHGLSHNLQPNGSYKVSLHASGTALGMLTADASGDIDASLTLPADTPPGSQAVDITGTDLAGQPIDITAPVFITGADGDSDADGLPDDQDSCPATPDSGQDADQDGTDDACDGFIAAAPSAPGGTAGDDNTSTGSTAAGQTGPPSSGSTTTISGSTDTPSTSANTASSISVATTAAVRPSQVPNSTPTAGAVLGARTATAGTPETLATNAQQHISQLRDNLATFHWLPWAIDIALVGMLLAASSALFGRLAGRRL